MSSVSSEDREKQLEMLDSFTKNVDMQLENILSSFGWSLENLDDKDGDYVLCPFNPAHRLPQKSLQQHITACQWRAEGYDKLDTELSEPTLPPDAPSSVKLDADLLAHILLTARQENPSLNLGVGDRLIPRTSDRIFSSFTRDERKAIYDYVIANTQNVDIGHEIADLNQKKAKDDDQKSISYVELLVQERNLKRRRAKHRGVHTNKKSHLEVMREVIEQQMEMFKEYLAEKNDPQNGSKEQTPQEANSDSSRNSRIPDVNFENRKYSSDWDANSESRISVSDRDANFGSRKFSSDRETNYHQRLGTNERYHSRGDRDMNYHQRMETNERYHPRGGDRKKRYTHQSDKDSHHDPYKRDTSRSSEKNESRDRSRHRDKSRDRKRHKSKDRYRDRSHERRESKHDDRRKRKRSKSKTKR